MFSKIIRVLKIELKLGYYLILWVLQRKRPVEGEHTYHRKSAVMALTFAFLFVTPAAILLLAFILAQEWLTWTLSILAFYALYWTLGLYASMVALPHLMKEDGFLIRYGVLSYVFIPYSDIESAELSLEGIGQKGDGVKFSSDEPTVFFSVGSTTRIKVSLKQPATPVLWGKKTVPVDSVFINADRPDLLVEDLKRHLPGISELE